MECKNLIDYLTIRWAGKSDPDEVVEQLGLDPALFEIRESSPLPGYRRSKVFGGIAVCYDSSGLFPDTKDSNHNSKSPEQMGVCVSMPGSGCRTFENMSVFRFKSEGAFAYLLQLVYLNPDINATRVDLAVDDHSGTLDMDTIIRYKSAQCIDSRITSFDVHISEKEGKCRGQTLYIGAPTSPFRIRIYDKAKEQFEPGEQGYNEPWVRVEMVMRGKLAQGFVAAYCNSDDLGQLASGILNDHIRFIERDDSNITRCSTAQFWLDFLQSVEAVKLLLPEPIQHTIERSKEWLMYQIAPSLAMYDQAFGTGGLIELLKFGRQRMSAKHRAILEDFEKRKAM
ncbi:replication initiation factor domain-containing protein [Butyricicoccus faecihominis]|uniref:replication initiation factor domain-containing protein n=1 Tax=Butyricicoccus faecihominis TaxID=1712515 RepID=UPI00247953E3|nr:replication initiation factor domain-containing protein [Butyricicoccus faecihominis]MCQ5129824.1 replication initiation factor domain-containing protein [Butyricicoccus faecihominis]